MDFFASMSQVRILNKFVGDGKKFTRAASGKAYGMTSAAVEETNCTHNEPSKQYLHGNTTYCSMK